MRTARASRSCATHGCRRAGFGRGRPVLLATVALVLGGAAAVHLTAHAAGPRLASFTPSGPVVLKSGQTVRGLHITSTSGPCVRGNGVQGVRILDSRIGPCGPGAAGVGVSLEGASDVQVRHVAFDDVSAALYVLSGRDGIVFEHNRVTRLRGPSPRGQMVQLDKTRGSGIRISCNVSDQPSPGHGAGPEDHVNVYRSAGTAGSPIEIAHNRIRGGGPSRSGGGILAGDGGSAHVVIRDNTLVDPGQYGIAIAGGQGIRVLRNRIYAVQPLPWNNVGLYVWNQSPQACGGHEVMHNQIVYVDATGRPNPAWNAGNCGPVTGWADNALGEPGNPQLGQDMFSEVAAECR